MSSALRLPAVIASGKGGRAKESSGPRDLVAKGSGTIVAITKVAITECKGL
jgi:hypothetical protein